MIDRLHTGVVKVLLQRLPRGEVLELGGVTFGAGGSVVLVVADFDELPAGPRVGEVGVEDVVGDVVDGLVGGGGPVRKGGDAGHGYASFRRDGGFGHRA